MKKEASPKCMWIKSKTSDKKKEVTLKRKGLRTRLPMKKEATP
jgi:hypothetical protein